MLKDIERYKGLYKIDEDGNVFSCKTNRYIKPHLGFGYYCVVLKGLDGKQHHEFIHRLLAETFIPNPQNLPVINHKDENKLNNDLTNLEWCTISYNNTYNGVAQKRALKIKETIKLKGGQWNKGKKMSDEQRQKISNSMKGHKFGNNQYTKNKTNN